MAIYKRERKGNADNHSWTFFNKLKLIDGTLIESFSLVNFLSILYFENKKYKREEEANSRICGGHSAGNLSQVGDVS